jgi:hypothetical protein
MAKEVAATQDNFPVDMSKYAGAGMEQMEAEDYAIPFIKIIQKASPIIDSNPDAKPGMFLNSVSGEIYHSLILVPCGFKKEVVQWADRNTGEGIRGSHAWDTPLMAETEPNDKGLPTFPEGHAHAGDHLIETRYHYVYVIVPDTGEAFPALIAMSSTQHKRSRRWVSLMGTKKVEIGGVRRPAPSFAYKYYAVTEKETRDKNTWYSWVITAGEQIEEEWLLQECIDFYTSVASDTVKVAPEDGGIE